MPELLPLAEACQVLKVHPNTLRKWDRKGILKAVCGLGSVEKEDIRRKI